MLSGMMLAYDIFRFTVQLLECESCMLNFEIIECSVENEIKKIIMLFKLSILRYKINICNPISIYLSINFLNSVGTDLRSPKRGFRYTTLSSQGDIMARHQ